MSNLFILGSLITPGIGLIFWTTVVFLILLVLLAEKKCVQIENLRHFCHVKKRLEEKCLAKIYQSLATKNIRNLNFF